MKIIGIYKITNPEGLIYIGQSIDIQARKWKYMSACCKNQTKIYNSLLMYGWDAHKFEVIHECKEDELNALEAYYIEVFDSLNNGLNLTGGYVFEMTQSHKDKISQSLKGIRHSRESYDRANAKKRGRKMSSDQYSRFMSTVMDNKAFMYSNRQLVYNVETGVFYDSAKEAAMVHGYNYNTFKGRLNGSKPNNTNFRYA